MTKKKAKKKNSKKEYSLSRPPVVTMLGHVDHGKTSLLDAIRGTKVQACEAGGITQTVRAHQIEHKTESGEKHQITFIDTPGHEAFTEMRSRGAHVTDIVVLVVAVNDGVQPQTKEAIKFAKKADVPIIVALNKIDIKGVDKEKVLRDLSTEGVQVEKLGGDVIYIETSAKKKTGIDELLNTILLVAEMNDLTEEKCEDAIGKAIVLESAVDKSLGAISLCLMKAGKIHVGDYAIYKNTNSRIRAIKNESFCDMKDASVSDPVWLLGFNTSIPVGAQIDFYSDVKDLRHAEAVKKLSKEEDVTESDEDDEEEMDPAIISQLLEQKKTKDEKAVVNVFLKADTQGTLEVVEGELQSLATEEVELAILNAATGDITEEDIFKAHDANGIVIGFNTPINKKLQRIAANEKVLVRNYEIIYDLLDEVTELIESLRKPEEVEQEIARAQVKKVFELSDGQKVAGCKVLKGLIVKGYTCYVERPSEKSKRIGEGKITSLKHGKEEVREAQKGTECGILIEPEIDIKKDDEIVCYKIEKK